MGENDNSNSLQYSYVMPNVLHLLLSGFVRTLEELQR